MSVQLDRIVVFRIGHLGDTLVALPAFWAIRKEFPNAQITLLSNADLGNPNYVSAASVLPKEGLFDAWLSYPNGISKLDSGIGYARLAAKLRKQQPCGLFYLPPRIRSEYQINRDLTFFRIAGVKRVFGTEYLREHLLPPRAFAPARLIESESEYMLGNLRAEGIVSANLPPDNSLLLTDLEKAAADAFLGKYVSGNFLNRPWIAVAPGSKWKSKVWAEEKYADIVIRLIREFDAFPIVFGGAEVVEKGQRLIDRWKRGANAAGVLGIREAAAALEKCDLYLGNDTGTMHLAAAAGAPCVAIFAAVDYPGRWYPTGDGHHVFRQAVKCEGCLTPDCFNHNLCLELIDPDDVYSACAKVLSESGLRPARLFELNRAS